MDVMHSLASPPPPSQISVVGRTLSQWQYLGAMSIGGRHCGALLLMADDVGCLNSRSCRSCSMGQRRLGWSHRGPGRGRAGKRACCAVRAWSMAHQSRYRRGGDDDRVLNIGGFVQLAGRKSRNLLEEGADNLVVGRYEARHPRTVSGCGCGCGCGCALLEWWSGWLKRYFSVVGWSG